MEFAERFIEYLYAREEEGTADDYLAVVHDFCCENANGIEEFFFMEEFLSDGME